jgi:uncharacterized protein (TIGR03067 family)
MAFVTTLSLSTLDDDPKQDNTKVDLQSIEGEWTSKDDQGESVWEFKGNKLVLKTPTRKYEIAIKVDASAKPYKTIDFNVDKDSPNAAGYKALGIYKLEGGKMTICFGSEENGRPKAFEGDFQSTFLFELTKKKAD